MTYKQHQQLDAIQTARKQAYQSLLIQTKFLLQHGPTFSYKYIYQAFQDYEKLAEKEEKYLLRVALKECSILQAIFTYKNPEDVYWDLPVQIKLLWDQVPELKAWRSNY